MTIEDLHNTVNIANGVEGSSRIDSARSKKETGKSGKPSEAPSAATSKGYQIQISPEGKNLSSIESDLRLIDVETKRLPDIRRDRIEATKQRLREGYYSTEKAIAKTAESIASDNMTEVMLATTLTKKGMTHLARNLPETDSARQERAKSRFRDGFYNTPSGIYALVDKILS